MRLCPICHKARLRRPEVHTCGAPTCIKQWRIMGPDERARAVEDSSDDIMDRVETYKQRFPSQSDSIPTIPTSSNERDEEFLRKLFGPDAPGIPKKEDKNPEDK